MQNVRDFQMAIPVPTYLLFRPSFIKRALFGVFPLVLDSVQKDSCSEKFLDLFDLSSKGKVSTVRIKRRPVRSCACFTPHEIGKVGKEADAEGRLGQFGLNTKCDTYLFYSFTSSKKKK